MKVIAKNKKAFFDYEIMQRFEAGIELVGSEIKSIRENNINIKGSYVVVRNGEVYWKSAFIKHWKFAASSNHEEYRDRKLLLHKKEIKKLLRAESEQGITIVPLALGLVRGRAKLEIAMARGKKKYDKRQSIKKRDLDRQMKTRIKDF